MLARSRARAPGTPHGNPDSRGDARPPPGRKKGGRAAPSAGGARVARSRSRHAGRRGVGGDRPAGRLGPDSPRPSPRLASPFGSAGGGARRGRARGVPSLAFGRLPPACSPRSRSPGWGCRGEAGRRSRGKPGPWKVVAGRGLFGSGPRGARRLLAPHFLGLAAPSEVRTLRARGCHRLRAPPAGLRRRVLRGEVGRMPRLFPGALDCRGEVALGVQTPPSPRRWRRLPRGPWVAGSPPFLLLAQPQFSDLVPAQPLGGTRVFTGPPRPSLSRLSRLQSLDLFVREVGTSQNPRIPIVIGTLGGELPTYPECWLEVRTSLVE